MKDTATLVKELRKRAEALNRPNTPIDTSEIVTLMNECADRMEELSENN